VNPAETLWDPAVNNHGGLAQRPLAQIEDPWHCVEEIREAMR
jgi:hypothetical protein